jgi:probable rRNA maturation factor
MITIELPPTIAASPDFALSKPGLMRFLQLARAAVGLDGEVHVLLAGDATLRRLNRTFRGKDKATDVLSFPAGPTTVFFGEPEGPGLAGDLAISLETAARHAARFGHTLRDEIRVLMLHGVLHLAGFDHEADSGQMGAREAELRLELRLPTSLIARVNVPAARGKNKQKTETEVGRSARNENPEGAAKKAVRKGPVRKRVRR